MKIGSLIFLFSIISFQTFSQNNVWVFSHNCGMMFNNNNTISLGHTHLNNIFEACISVSDSNNQLLFYSDGTNIYNKLDQIMDNGYKISLLSNQNSVSQGVSYLKLDSGYYMFFAADYFGINNYKGCFTWGIIDMKLNNGLGRVIKKRQFLADSLSEAQAIYESKDKNYIIFKSVLNDHFKVFEINKETKDVSFSKNIPFNSFPYLNVVSVMKVSPNGKILANTNHELKNVELFCIQDNPFDIKYIGTINKFSQKLIHVYGCEFSSDNTKLYFTSGNYLFQADLSSLNIDTINKSLYELYGPLNLDSNQFTCPQLGPDKKIYIKEGYYGNISIIKSPNLTASNCQFQFNGLSIPNCDYYGNLPYFQTYYLNEDTLFQMTFPCKDPEDTSYFEMPDVFTPNGDGMNDTLSLYFKNISDFYLNIYNRWGELVFESKIPDFKWDGTFNGQKCAEGSYYAIFNYTSYKKEAKSKKIIQLIR